jgi:hypothetical protein
MSDQEIHDICYRYKIENYHINEDGTIDVDEDVLLSHRSLSELPLRFGRVAGFNIAYNKLTSLEGCPTKVDGHFSCARNELTDLKYGPIEVGGDFYFNDNRITSLIGSPKRVGGFFHGRGNQLTSYKDGPEYVGGHYLCGNLNGQYNLDGFDTKVGDVIYNGNSPLGSIFDSGDQQFIDAFKAYKVVKDKTVNLKRLKYVMSIFDKKIDLEKIERNYTIV